MPFGEQRTIYSLLLGKEMKSIVREFPTPSGMEEVADPPVDLGVSVLFEIFDLPSPSCVFMEQEEIDFLKEFVSFIRGYDVDSIGDRLERIEQIRAVMNK